MPAACGYVELVAMSSGVSRCGGASSHVQKVSMTGKGAKST